MIQERLADDRCAQYRLGESASDSNLIFNEVSARPDKKCFVACPRRLREFRPSDCRRIQVKTQKRFTPEEFIGKLRHADVLLGQGKKVAEITN